MSKYQYVQAFVQYEQSRNEFVLYRRKDDGATEEIACCLNANGLDEMLYEELHK